MICRKYGIYFLMLLLLASCSDSDNVTTIKQEFEENNNTTYILEKGKYQLNEDIAYTSFKMTNLKSGELYYDTAYTDTSSGSILVLLNQGSDYTIEKFEDNFLYLIKRSKSSYDDYNVNYNWRMKFEITQGSKDAFENGETIELTEVETDERIKTDEVYHVAKYTRIWQNLHAEGYYYDPTESKAKTLVKKLKLLINKEEIKEESSSKMEATMKIVKATS